MNEFEVLAAEYESFIGNSTSESIKVLSSRGVPLRGNVGKQMFEHVSELVTSRRFTRYTPDFYNRGVNWNREEKEDLASELIADVLIGDGKIDYLFDVADSIESLNKVLNAMINRLLTRRLIKTLATNQIVRLKKKFKEDGFEEVKTANGIWYRPPKSISIPKEFEVGQLRFLVEEIRKIPRKPVNSNSERATMVWSTAAFNLVIKQILEVRGGLYLRDFDQILKELLTDSLPKSLIHLDGQSRSAIDDIESRNSSRPNTTGSMRKSEVESTFGDIELKGFIQNYVADLKPNEIAVLALKGGMGLSDEESLPYLHVARPTFQKIREAVYLKVKKDFESIPLDQLSDATFELVQECSSVFSDRMDK